MRVGSSPLARGLPRQRRHPRPRRRIIPARAGFTSTRRLTITPTWDHPRSRGVYSGGRSSPRPRRGSSPLARGLRLILTRIFGGRRIIPARAGFTRYRRRPRPCSSDHPRSRGVYSTSHSSFLGRNGSSPLARGLLVRATGFTCALGIIPARAGFTGPRARAG